MRIIVFANGIINHIPTAQQYLHPGDLVIAADGGARHCRAMGRIPDVVIGDMDSLTQSEVEALERDGAEMIRHPARKDQTDLELALRLALERGGDEILVLGALGERWDMTLANVLILAAPEFSGVRLRLIDDRHEIVLLKGGDRVELPGKQGDVLSLVPLGCDAVGVTLHGLDYPLKDATIRLGSTLGISNVLLGNSTVVELKKGLLLCVLMHV